MPKKFVGENSKAVAAKARKSEKADAEKGKKEKDKEDAEWADDNKSDKKKQARKEDAERKKQGALEKKQERDRMLADEESQVKGPSKKSAKKPSKVTRAQIQENADTKNITAETKVSKETHIEIPLEENLNRVDIGSETATNLDEAISVLSLNDSSSTVDKHPEKRMKAAYEEFETARLPQLKAENPGLRLSQLKQMIWKEWTKSPENPLNKKLAAMDS